MNDRMTRMTKLANDLGGCRVILTVTVSSYLDAIFQYIGVYSVSNNL